MQRETSVKGLIFSNPALYIEPFSGLGEPFVAKARSQPKTEFIIFFLGSYGQSVFAEFRQLRKRYPIWVRRRDITMDVYSEEGFIPVSDEHDPVELLAASCNCDFACFVMDVREPGSAALAETICRILHDSTDALLSCFSPVITEVVKKDMFNLSVETLSVGQDLCAHLLIALYNNYLGERGFKDLCSSKSFYDYWLKDHHLQARGDMAIHDGDLNTLDSQKLVTEANQSIQDLIRIGVKGRYLAFFEMYPTNEDVIMFIAVDVEKELHAFTEGRKKGKGNILVCNCAYPQKETKLTLFYLYDRG